LYSHRGTRAVQRMVEYAPSTGGLALWVRHQDMRGEGAEDGAAPAPVVTDGHALYYHECFERLTVAEQAGLVAHEVLHIALRHSQRFVELDLSSGDADLRLYNICADAIVNSTLSHVSWLTLPPSSVFLDQVLSRTLHVDQPVEKSLLEWDVERLYRAIDDRQGGKDGPRAAQLRALGGGKGVDLMPRPDPRAPPEAEAEEIRMWSERILRAHAGDAEHSLLRTLLADVARIRTPWEQLLRTFLARSLTPKLEESWSRPARSYIANQGRAGPHRRMPWTPSFRLSRSRLQLAVIVDVSGSMSAKLLQRFSREIEAITRRLEAGLVLIVGDDRVRRVERFEPGEFDLSGPEFQGGGGTDFTPLLEEADSHRPDVAVVLTDLDGPARHRPRWPVIWAVPEEHAYRPQPFGRKLILK
jgi:predicted metal-dependent peptidase